MASPGHKVGNIYICKFHTPGSPNQISDHSICFISNQSAHNRLIPVHLTGTKKGYSSEKMKIFYNILRADCVYSVIFIHISILSMDSY